MFLEVMMTQFQKKGQFAKSIIGQVNIYMEETQRFRKREKNREEFQHQNKRHSHADPYFFFNFINFFLI